MAVIYLVFLSLLFTSCMCNKYSEKMNSPEYQKLLSLDKPFRMQKLNLVWEKAAKKMSPEKLKLLYTDLKFQDKEELAWKKQKAEGRDKNGLKEAVIQGSFKAILEKYHLVDDFRDLKDSVKATPDISDDAYMKTVFKDKKLNKLWLKAEQQGFSEEQLNMLKEEFQHHQNKIDQYYQVLNQLHKEPTNNEVGNTIDHILHAEEGEKVWKADNPHQILKEKHAQLKAGYDYLTSKIIPNFRNLEFEEPQVNSLWEMAKNASFTPEELESLRGELHHFEHRIRKLKTLASLEMERDHSNHVDEVVAKREKRLKEYNYKVEKIQKELTNRILQR
ncbi:Alpha-2-macroglobulin receptor-associated protein, partial [Stegodyphus mimosarum]